MLSGEALGFAVFIMAYGYLIAKYIPKRYYVVTNVLTAAGALVYAWFSGASWGSLGLGWSQLFTGLVAGLLVSIPIIIIIIGVAAIPMFRNFFSDGPSKHASTKVTRFELAVRIPFGTALSEEILFRSVLLSLLMAAYNTLWAVIIASALFGIWHIIPTLDTLSRNDSFSTLIDEYRHRRVLSLLLTILVTMVAGIGFCMLRLWTGSVATPWVVHTMINSVAVMSGFLVMRINGRQKDHK